MTFDRPLERYCLGLHPRCSLVNLPKKEVLGKPRRMAISLHERDVLSNKLRICSVSCSFIHFDTVFPVSFFTICERYFDETHNLSA